MYKWFNLNLSTMSTKCLKVEIFPDRNNLETHHTGSVESAKESGPVVFIRVLDWL